MLTTLDINRLLKKVPHFGGVYPINRLPIILKKPVSLVINLDPSYKEGSHWVAVYFEVSGYGYYFDSYGKEPTSHVLTLLERFAPKGYSFSKHKFQDDFSTSCGYFCVLFVILANSRRKFLNLFEKCRTERNERKLLQLIKLII